MITFLKIDRPSRTRKSVCESYRKWIHVSWIRVAVILRVAEPERNADSPKREKETERETGCPSSLRRRERGEGCASATFSKNVMPSCHCENNFAPTAARTVYNSSSPAMKFTLRWTMPINIHTIKASVLEFRRRYYKAVFVLPRARGYAKSWQSYGGYFLRERQRARRKRAEPTFGARR